MSDPSHKLPPALRFMALLGVALIVGFISAALFGEGGVSRHERLGAELRQVNTLNAQLAADNRRLAAEVKALNTDPRYVEHVIREELGWVAPDDVVLIFPEASNTP